MQEISTEVVSQENAINFWNLIGISFLVSIEVFLNFLNLILFELISVALLVSSN